MKAIKVEDVEIHKPIVIAAMQDMGNVGSIAIDFINKSVGTSYFGTFQNLSPTMSSTTADTSIFSRKSGNIGMALEDRLSYLEEG